MRLRPRARAIPRRRGAFGGLLIALLGLWGALIPFIGPSFDYEIGTTASWDWAIDRLWLSVLPGAAAVLGGLILTRSTTRRSAAFGSLLGLAGGLWFVAGPATSMLWNGGDPATGAAVGDSGTRVLEWLGFFYGIGALITLLSSYELGRLTALPVEAVEPVAAPAAAPDETVTPDGQPAPARRSRRFLPRRRRRDPAEAEQAPVSR